MYVIYTFIYLLYTLYLVQISHKLKILKLHLKNVLFSKFYCTIVFKNVLIIYQNYGKNVKLLTKKNFEFKTTVVVVLL